MVAMWWIHSTIPIGAIDLLTVVSMIRFTDLTWDQAGR